MAGPSAFFTQPPEAKSRHNGTVPRSNDGSASGTRSSNPSHRNTRESRGRGERVSERSTRARQQQRTDQISSTPLSARSVRPHTRGVRLPPIFNDGRGFRSRAHLSNPNKPSALLNSAKATTVTSFSGKYDPWDQQNQSELRRMAAQLGNNADVQEVYNEFQKKRTIERKEMEKRGLVDAPDTRKSLTDALVFSGSCLEMCPVFERVRRIHEKMIMNLERDDDGRVTEKRAVKAFCRPAAGQLPPLPSDVRPPSVLVETLSYLIRVIYPKLPSSHPFLWDRLRSIRQDFTYQNYVGPEAILCNEVIVRTHISTMHVMADSGVEYSQQQEFEQLNKALQSLSEFYNMQSDRTKELVPHEAEMRAFQLLSHLFDKDLNSQIDSLPQHVREDPLVSLARELRGYVNKPAADSSGFIAAFFWRMRQPEVPILFKCLLEPSFMTIRLNALRSLNSVLHARKKEYPVHRFMEMLGFGTDEELKVFLDETGLITTIDSEIGPKIEIAAISDELYNKTKSIHHRSSLFLTSPSFDDILQGSQYNLPSGVAARAQAEAERILDVSSVKQKLATVKLLPDFSEEAWARNMEDILAASKSISKPSENSTTQFSFTTGAATAPLATIVPSGKFAKFKEMQARKAANQQANSSSSTQPQNQVNMPFIFGGGNSTPATLPTAPQAVSAFNLPAFSPSQRPGPPLVPFDSVNRQPSSQMFSQSQPGLNLATSTSKYSTTLPDTSQGPQRILAPFKSGLGQTFSNPNVSGASFASPVPNSVEPSSRSNTNKLEIGTMLNPVPPAQTKPSIADSPKPLNLGITQNPLGAATATSSTSSFLPSQHATTSTAASKSTTSTSAAAFQLEQQPNLEKPIEKQTVGPAEQAEHLISIQPSTNLLEASPNLVPSHSAALTREETVKRIVEYVTAEALRVEAYNIAKFEAMLARTSVELAERKGLQALLSGALQINLTQKETVESAIPHNEEEILEPILTAMYNKNYSRILIGLPDWSEFLGVLIQWNLQLEPVQGSKGTHYIASHTIFDQEVYFTTCVEEAVDLAIFINREPETVDAQIVATLKLPEQASVVRAGLLEFCDDLPVLEFGDDDEEEYDNMVESDVDGSSIMSVDLIEDCLAEPEHESELSADIDRRYKRPRLILD